MAADILESVMYELLVDVERTVVERYKVTVEASDPEEAQDIVYEYFQDYPTGNDFIKTKLRTQENTMVSNVLGVEFPHKENVANEVFNEDDDIA
jgi:hypothetical protein